MNLLEVRQQFRTLSGRFDLVNSDGSDNGANFLLNSGIKWLDSRVTHQKTAGRFFKIVEVGAYYVTFPYCRSIKEVWVASDKIRWQLKKKTIQDFRTLYSAPWSDVAEADPIYYTPAYLRPVPETNMEGFNSMIGWADVMIGENYGYNGVLFAPKTAASRQVEVWGHFHVIPLVADTDKNYWTVNYPDLLIMAALRQAEVFSRNTQGVNDWERAIESLLNGIDMDMVEEDIAEVTQMEG